MPRSRALSFFTTWGAGPRSPITEAPPSPTKRQPSPSENSTPQKPPNIDTITPQSQASKLDMLTKMSPHSPSHTPSRARGDSRANTRPNSMIHTYQPPQMEVAADTPAELQPIFSYLNSHSNKLYQEGYFLKLHDLDSRGRPSADRAWLECFAQLVGTVLSLWDAAALDAAGEDGEVVPTFINLSDASIKMIESLPMSGAQGGNLQNVLSISTAANNRYLLHFDSLNSLTQWTAGIRLAMFEHSTLQEAYTGSLIAGKGRLLNNIKAIMDRARFPHEDWARVRFGAGTAWKRCWCVITPPDEKEFQKAQKTLKKTSAYERVKLPKGDIKFYDTRKVTKKTRPIATITDAYAAYAIYPQSKPLIDQSTLVKLEGLVTIHGSPDSMTEGFVFIMPEVHPAVTGFEMMLRFLFPVFDTFGLYGRPNRLIADTLDQRGLMFAMPRDRRYGYLDILDVSALLHTNGSPAWSERQWKREMKKLTSTRMSTQTEGPPASTVHLAQRRNTTTSRTSRSPAPGGVRFEEGGSTGSAPGSRSASHGPLSGPEMRGFNLPKRTDSAPPGAFVSPHKRSVSDAQGYRRWETQTPSRLSFSANRDEEEVAAPPPPPKHGGALGASLGRTHPPGSLGSLGRIQSGEEVPTMGSFPDLQPQPASSSHLIPPEPILSPPAFTHNPNSRPANQPTVAPELRRAHSNVDAATLYQMQDAQRREDSPEEEWSGDVQMRQQQQQYQHQQQYQQQQYQPQQHYQNSVSSNTLANRSLGMPADRSQGILNEIPNGKLRDPRQRLSTIQGSPYVGGDAEQFQSFEAANGLSQMDGAADERPTMAQRMPSGTSLQSARSIARKPLPGKLVDIPIRSEPLPFEHAERERGPTEALLSPPSPVNNESVIGDLIDGAALERILNGGASLRTGTMTTAQSSEPDYASIVEPEVKAPVERVRAGKLKTVGDPDMPPLHKRSGSAGKLDTWEHDEAEKVAEVPTVDFGPTLLYKPTGRPDTSGTLTAGTLGERSRSRSQDRLRNSSTERLSRMTPTENNRHSYFGGATTPSPGGMTPTSGGPSPSRTPGDRRSVAWQPASPSGAPVNYESLTPEQWVQHRAAIASQPQQVPQRRPVSGFTHHRTMSGSSAQQLRRSLTKTPPPLSRTPSGDWTQYATGYGRTPPSRPGSRGANAVFNQPSPLNSSQPTSLTAKEQMHVARATGTPLLNYTSKSEKKQQEVHQPGLFGALAAREREREESSKSRNRYSMNNQMVQQAIATRHQQQMEVEERARAEYQMKAQYEAAKQAQAAQQNHAVMMQQQQAQMQQHLDYQSAMLAQSQAHGGGYAAQQGQSQAPSMYGTAPQQRPGVQTQGSWQQQQQPMQQGYGMMASPGVQTPGSAYSSPFAQQNWESQQAVWQGQRSMSPDGGAMGQQWQQQQRRA